MKAKQSPKNTEMTEMTEAAESQHWNNLDSDDIVPVYLQIVQKTSKAVESGIRPGTIALAQGEEFYEVEDGVRMRLLSIRKSYEDDHPYGSEEITERYDNLKEVLEVGKTAADVREVYSIKMLLQTDTPSAIGLPTALDGGEELWTPVIATWRKTACKGAKMIATALNNRARAIGDGFHPRNVEFHLSLKKNEFNKNTYWTPLPQIVSEPVKDIDAPNLLTA
jgi:hypothetical protein